MKLSGNGLWESSGIILPEHRQALSEYFDKQRERKKVTLDESELEQLSYHIQESMHLRIPITLQMYDIYEEILVIGIVERVDTIKKCFRINGDWFKVSDVEKIIE